MGLGGVTLRLDLAVRVRLSLGLGVRGPDHPYLGLGVLSLASRGSLGLASGLRELGFDSDLTRRAYPIPSIVLSECFGGFAILA